MLLSEIVWKRLDTARRIEAGELTVGEAAKVLGLSLRHTRRVRQRAGVSQTRSRRHGFAKLVHAYSFRWRSRAPQALTMPVPATAARRPLPTEARWLKISKSISSIRSRISE